MRRGGAVALLLVASTAGLSHADDLARVRAEPNLEKRARLALAESDAAMDAARSDYQRGDTDRVAGDAAKIIDFVDLAFLSLNQTGKDPRRNPKWFKRAEIATRVLLRRMGAFQQAMSFLERPMLDAVKDSVQQVHDKLLMGLMEGKRK